MLPEHHASKILDMRMFDELPEELRNFLNNCGVEIKPIYNKWKEGVDTKWILITSRRNHSLNRHVFVSREYGPKHPDLHKIALGQI